MHQVRLGTMYMPKAEDVNACRMVAYPPTNDMIMAHVSAAIENLNNVEGWTEETLVPVKALEEVVKKKKADKQWLLRLLYCFDPGNQFFASDYRYVKPRKRLNPDNIQVFDNADGFFDNLPPL